MDFQAMVNEYVTLGRPAAQMELDYYRRQPSHKAAVREAGLAHDAEGKKDFHQWRFRQSTLNASTHRLLDEIPNIMAATTFDELHDVVVRTLKRVKGAGELYCYDTALRIGAKKNMLPTKVYLHCGTREGAKALKLDVRAVALETTMFPPEFQRLPAYQIEDLLCMARHWLRGDYPRRDLRYSRCIETPKQRICKQLFPPVSRGA